MLHNKDIVFIADYQKNILSWSAIPIMLIIDIIKLIDDTWRFVFD